MLRLKGLIGVGLCVVVILLMYYFGNVYPPTVYVFGSFEFLFWWTIWCSVLQIILLILRLVMTAYRRVLTSVSERRRFRNYISFIDWIVYGEGFSRWNLFKQFLLNAFMIMGTRLFLLSGDSYFSWFNLNEFYLVGASVCFFLAYYPQFARPNLQTSTP